MKKVFALLFALLALLLVPACGDDDVEEPSDPTMPGEIIVTVPSPSGPSGFEDF